MLSDKERTELNKIYGKENSFFSIMFIFIFIIISLLIFITNYMITTKLDVIANTEGVVVPSSKVKSIQHLEGGIVKKLNVNVGDIVKKDDILLELEPIESLSNFSELEKRLSTLFINIQRLRAEADLKNLIFEKKIISKYPRLVDDAKKLYKARKEKYLSLLSEQKKNFRK